MIKLCMSLQALRDKSDTPSNLTLKLRKHLRTKRLDDVRQLGVDRLVDFCFGSGPNCHHLLLELYAQVAMHPRSFHQCLTACWYTGSTDVAGRHTEALGSMVDCGCCWMLPASNHISIMLAVMTNS